MHLAGYRSTRVGWAGQTNAAIAAVGLTVLMAAGCGGGSKKVADPPTATTVTSDRTTTAVSPTTSTTGSAVTTQATTTTPGDPAAAEIVARYKQFWQARFTANQVPPNPDLPALKEYATGQQLDQVIKETRGNLQNSLAFRRPGGTPPRSSVKVVNVNGDEVTVQECVVDDDVVYRYTTGEVVNATVATNSVEATMRRVGGVWKLAGARLIQRWEGVAGCALSSGF